MKKLLVTICNQNYLDQAKQLFASVFLNGGWTGLYMLLHDQDVTDLRWFHDRGILTKQATRICDKTICNFPPIVWAKCQLFSEEFAEWDQIVYLDADIIVQNSIDHFQTTNLLACEDVQKYAHMQFISWPEKLDFISNISGWDVCFNVGVLIKSNIVIPDLEKKISNIIKVCNNNLLYPEQITLNILFHRKWGELDMVYNASPANLCSGFGFPFKDIEKLAVLHFYGWPEWKAWLPSSPFYNIWLDNLKKADNIDFQSEPPKSKCCDYSDALKDHIQVFEQKYKRKNLLPKESLWTVFGHHWKDIYELDVNWFFRTQCRNPFNIQKELTIFYPSSYTGRGSTDSRMGMRNSLRKEHLKEISKK